MQTSLSKSTTGEQISEILDLKVRQGNKVLCLESQMT